MGEEVWVFLSGVDKGVLRGGMGKVYGAETLGMEARCSVLEYLCSMHR